MSGVTGSDRILHGDLEWVIRDYEREVLMKFPGYEDFLVSGSATAGTSPVDHGDIDLIVRTSGYESKVDAKRAFIKHVSAMPDDEIIPFQSEKYKGKKFYISGEIVTISFPQATGRTCQIDNIFAESVSEQYYKLNFLNMPAEKQGLVLGLVKTIFIEQDVDWSWVPPKELLESNQEYEFNVSPVEIQLRRVTYNEEALLKGQYLQIDREVIWRSHERLVLDLMLADYDFSFDFDNLLSQINMTLKHSRSRKRLVGTFNAMVSIKSGEVGTEKARRKQYALDRVSEIILGEDYV